MAMMKFPEDRDIDADVTIKVDVLTSARLAALDLPTDLDVHAASALTSELRTTLCRLTPPAPRTPHDEGQRRLPAITMPPAAPRRASARPVAANRSRALSSRPLSVASTVARIAALVATIGAALVPLIAQGRDRARSLGRTIAELAARRLTAENRRRVVAGLRDQVRVLRRRSDGLRAQLSLAASRAWIGLWHSRRISRLTRVWGPGPHVVRAGTERSEEREGMRIVT